MTKPALIAELGLSHDGSLWLAHSLLDACADAGATHVKLQAHSPLESSALETWRTPPPTGESRADYWRRTSFTVEQWAQLRTHADRRGVQFGVSVFHDSLVADLAPLVQFWKIPSGAADYEALLDRVSLHEKPTYWADGLYRPLLFRPTEALGWTRLICTSKYPTPVVEAGLNEIRTGVDGLSDHTGEPLTAALATFAGAVAVEVHVTFDTRTGLPDATSSLTIDQLAEARRWMDLAFAAKHGSRPAPDPAMQRKYGYALRGDVWSKPADMAKESR
jgi:N,N'-diacetyllegionaminate synthase